jgi:hypothetical protein
LKFTHPYPSQEETHPPPPSLLQTQKRGGESAPYPPSLPRREGAGGELTTTMPLSDTLRLAEQQGGRTALGIDLFRKLFEDHTLYAVVGKQQKPVQRFRSDLFFRLWSQLDYICTQEHKILTNLSSLE